MITFKAKTQSGEIINSALSAFTFPAGEAHTKREEQRDLEPVEIAVFQPSPESLHTDLFQIAMWTEVVHSHSLITGDRPKSVLIMPYVPGARADRGVPFGLDIYTSFLNDLLIDQIIIFDPHSEVTPEYLVGYKYTTVLYSHDFLAQPQLTHILKDYTGIIAPDKGAVDRATAVADLVGLPVYTAQKTRDFETGKLTGFAIEGLPSNGKYLIVDDICDGGGTFLGLAAATGLPKDQLDLFVSHGVFSKIALETLPEKFETVFTTNSFNPTRHLNTDPDKFPTFVRFDIVRFLMSKIVY